MEPEWCEPGDDHQSQRSSMRQGHCPLRESCSVYSVEVALLTSAQWTTEAKSKLATVILYMWIGIANFCYAFGFVKTKTIDDKSYQHKENRRLCSLNTRSDHRSGIVQYGF